MGRSFFGLLVQPLHQRGDFCGHHVKGGDDGGVFGLATGIFARRRCILARQCADAGIRDRRQRRARGTQLIRQGRNGRKDGGRR